MAALGQGPLLVDLYRKYLLSELTPANLTLLTLEYLVPGCDGNIAIVRSTALSNI